MFNFKKITIMKKLYIQPVTESQQTRCAHNLCVGSVQSNLDINYIGNIDEDPI